MHVLKKLIENWLDNASEKSYQAVFCQMLLHKGYTVIHTTRHCPMEYGKDVIAIAPDGITCAYQLKGNPGRRLTLTQYRDIAPQLFELVNQRIDHPQIKNDKSHRSYLVTNGHIDEEAEQAIVHQNAKNETDGYPDRKLEIIAREQLLKWSYELEDSLWPSELEDIKLLLELLTQTGDEIFPLDIWNKLLTHILRLSTSDKKCSNSEFRRRVSSSALLTAVALTAFSEKKNHWAIVCAWTMLSIYLISAKEKHKKFEKDIVDTLIFAEEIIFDELKSLIEEALESKGFLTEGNEITDFAVYSWRYTLLVSLSSLFWLWAERDNIWPNRKFKNRLKIFIPDNQNEMDLWGEAAIPQYLTHIWQISSIGNKNKSDILTKDLIKLCINESIPTVYYDAEQVIKNRLAQSLECFDPSFEKPPRELSWFAQQLFLHMVFRDLKECCVELWSEYSLNTVSVSFVPEQPWQFCLYRTEYGENISYVPPVTGEWSIIKSEASIDASNLVPDSLLKRPVLLWLWCLLCPQRALSPVICHVFSYFLQREATQ